MVWALNWVVVCDTNSSDSLTKKYWIWQVPGDCVYLHKARMSSEQREPSFSPPSALALSNMEEGMGHNIERAQALQEDLSQRRASLQHHSAEAQALQGQEALLADIIEEMAHQTQVSVLSQLHL